VRVHVEFEVGISSTATSVDWLFFLRAEHEHLVLVSLDSFDDHAQDLAGIVRGDQILVLL